ncbi:WD_REPEATS_REGION domain-containing protein [Haematococcus lacustris]|uniref:WD_REPEATS_REGION domain-containing protein n=1 Tax=Haematococcus lacustris TaxID=44745 RepID=A0A699YIF9_HAELA|nr:WD_REPEATS_REGION domain-containing protein [Haematococcus lacustris]
MQAYVEVQALTQDEDQAFSHAQRLLADATSGNEASLAAWDAEVCSALSTVSTLLSSPQVAADLQALQPPSRSSAELKLAQLSELGQVVVDLPGCAVAALPFGPPVATVIGGIYIRAAQAAKHSRNCARLLALVQQCDRQLAEVMRGVKQQQGGLKVAAEARQGLRTMTDLLVKASGLITSHTGRGFLMRAVLSACDKDTFEALSAQIREAMQAWWSETIGLLEMRVATSEFLAHLVNWSKETRLSGRLAAYDRRLREECKLPLLPHQEHAFLNYILIPLIDTDKDGFVSHHFFTEGQARSQGRTMLLCLAQQLAERLPGMANLLVPVVEQHGDATQLSLQDTFIRFLHLPQWVRVLVTGRPKLEHAFNAWKPECMKLEGKDNQADLLQLLLWRLGKDELVAEIDLGAAALLVLRKSLGQFIYTKYALDVLAEEATWTLQEMETRLPNGLEGMYLRELSTLQEALRKERPDLLELLHTRLLPVLVACLEPLTVSELAWAMGCEADTGKVQQLVGLLANLFPYRAGHLFSE